MDLIPLANAVFHDCSYDSSQAKSAVLEELRRLACTPVHTEVHVELLFDKWARFGVNALPCPLDKYRLHKCGKFPSYFLLWIILFLKRFVSKDAWPRIYNQTHLNGKCAFGNAVDTFQHLQKLASF